MRLVADRYWDRIFLACGDLFFPCLLGLLADFCADPIGLFSMYQFWFGVLLALTIGVVLFLLFVTGVFGIARMLATDFMLLTKLLHDLLSPSSWSFGTVPMLMKSVLPLWKSTYLVTVKTRLARICMNLLVWKCLSTLEWESMPKYSLCRRWSLQTWFLSWLDLSCLR